jgi:hypothetical protein
MRIGSNTIFGILIFIAVIFTSLILQSTLVNEILSPYLYPDILLVMIVYVGLRRELTEGIIWTLLISYTYSIHSGLTTISSSLLMLLVFFASRYIGRNFYLLTEKEYFLGMAIPIFVQKIVLSLWLHWHDGGVFLVPILQSITTTLSTALFGILILKMLTAIDIWSGRLDETSLIGKKG